MNFIKNFFISKRQKLLNQSSSDYDSCSRGKYTLPYISDGESLIHRYSDRIGQIINIAVYDCFEGDVKLLAIGEDRIYVEIVDVTTCYRCQIAPEPGTKYWIGNWEIPNEDIKPKRGFEPTDLPF